MVSIRVTGVCVCVSFVSNFRHRREAIDIAQQKKQWSTAIALAHRAGYTDSEARVFAYVAVSSVVYCNAVYACVCDDDCILLQITKLALSMARNLRELDNESKRVAAGLLVSADFSNRVRYQAAPRSLALCLGCDGAFLVRVCGCLCCIGPGGVRTRPRRRRGASV